MEQDKIKKVLDLIKKIEVTEENKEDIKEIKELIKSENYAEAMQLLQRINKEGKIKLIQQKEVQKQPLKSEFKETEEETEIDLDSSDTEMYEEGKKVDNENDEPQEEEIYDEEMEEPEDKESIYPKALSNQELEEKYISCLLANSKAISMYYILHEDCYFENDTFLNLYKSVLFTEGEAYAPQIAKNDYNFAVDGPETYELKFGLKEKAKKNKYDFEKIYVALRKLFEIRKNYLINPIKDTQDQIVGILKYELYDKMTIEEVKNAIEQIIAT